MEAPLKKVRFIGPDGAAGFNEVWLLLPDQVGRRRRTTQPHIRGGKRAASRVTPRWGRWAEPRLRG